MTSNSPKRTGGSSLERMLAILGLFTEDQLEWTSDEMIERLGYARPTLYRYLKILGEAGLLSSLPPGRFTVGPMVVELDYILRMSDPLLLAGTDAIDRLASNFSCTAMLLRWYQNRILCVYSKCSMKQPLSSYPRGRPMQLGRGAIGRSIIANLPQRQSLPLIKQYLQDLRDVGFGDTIEDVYVGLRQIRKQGVCVAHGEVTPGVVGTAAPVFDAGAWPIGSVCVTVSASETPNSVLDDVVAQVRDTAASISEALRAAPRRHSVS